MTILGTITDSLARRIGIFGVVISMVALGVFVFSWRDARESRTRLQATIDAANKTIADAGDRETARDAQLKQSLAALAAVKERAKTPAEAALAITSSLPQLPEPIQIELPEQTSGSLQTPAERSAPNRSASESATAGPAIAQIPQDDLKPLLDAAEDCRACQLKLAAAQADLSDQAAKLAATSSERDAAIKAAKGGPTWTRIMRAAKWLIIGAAAGALSARAAR